MDIADDLFLLIDSLVEHACCAADATSGASYRAHAAKVRKAIRTIAVRFGVPLDGKFREMLEERYGGQGPRSRVRNVAPEVKQHACP